MTGQIWKVKSKKIRGLVELFLLNCWALINIVTCLQPSSSEASDTPGAVSLSIWNSTWNAWRWGQCILLTGAASFSSRVRELSKGPWDPPPPSSSNLGSLLQLKTMDLCRSPFSPGERKLQSISHLGTPQSVGQWSRFCQCLLAVCTVFMWVNLAVSHLSLLDSVVPGSASHCQGYRVGYGEGIAFKDEHSPGCP